MSRKSFNFIVSTLYCFLAVLNISAQQAEEDKQILSQIKIESFDWYAKRDVAEPTSIKNYRRGQPEGKSSNFPAQNSSPSSESEKFIYRIRIRNLSEREITSLVWRYQFVNPLTKELMGTLEFASEARIKPHRRKTVYAESFSLPVSAIDINLLLLNKNQPFLESVKVKSLVFDELVKKTEKN